MSDDPRQPLPSEDTGDLVDEPATGFTSDPLVAREEGVPWIPPTERDGLPSDPEDVLEADDTIQADGPPTPRDEALLAHVMGVLRGSDLPAGERIRVAASGTTVFVRGTVASITTAEEILALVGDVPGVEDVVDELEVSGA
jgi:hypothetical protein